jgi:hypothetical protein
MLVNKVMELIDFNGYEQNDRMYGGLSGNKVGICYNGENYILKFPGNLKGRDMKNIQLSYSNSPVCEYLGSHIYQKLGIAVHDTLLGVRNGKIVVACKDFLERGDRLNEFREIKTTYEPQFLDLNGNATSGTGTDLLETISTIDEHPFFKNVKNIKERFWDMFVVDAYIGNSDRNNGNWGVIVRLNGIKEIAPVYDNGGCLNNKWDDEKMNRAINDAEAFKAQSYNGVTCIFTSNSKKINPFHFIQKMESPDCSLAVKRLIPRIRKSRSEIHSIINNNSVLSDPQKIFYCKILDERLDQVLIPIYRKIMTKECCNQR